MLREKILIVLLIAAAVFLFKHVDRTTSRSEQMAAEYLETLQPLKQTLQSFEYRLPHRNLDHSN